MDLNFVYLTGVGEHVDAVETRSIIEIIIDISQRFGESITFND